MGFLRSLRSRISRREEGNILIEFALALPVLLLLLGGMLDLGRYALQKSAILEGARQGAQYGVLVYSGASTASSTDSANVNATAQNASALSGVTATNSLFCECVAGTAVACTTTCSSGTLKRYVTVNTSKAFSSVVTSSTLSFGAFGSWTPPTSMSASITMIVP
ncbi:Flp pilus assembly protein TadG [Enhydrobacter aerosaccus]|uniref:Flp pilus assembly protein TadG n=2 Tax=Enhydrobacter aerosaccus TaxID=225324 RepID=A0A1T4T8U1_9HYPH|nr:Flp pilus assembly protein TadG [Enhydrobacter aerosaccus]